MPDLPLFSTVPTNDYLSLFQGGRTDYRKVVELLALSKQEVARASNVPKQFVRYDQRIPKELENRIKEWAIAVAQVAAYFRDAQKTALWFQVPNPQLGNVPPRDMIRFGRFRKLNRFIFNALSQNERDAE
jgi:hypothetical protein